MRDADDTTINGGQLTPAMGIKHAGHTSYAPISQELGKIYNLKALRSSRLNEMLLHHNGQESQKENFSKISLGFDVKKKSAHYVTFSGNNQLRVRSHEDKNSNFQRENASASIYSLASSIQKDPTAH